MFITTYKDTHEFLARVQPILEQNEVANSRLLGIALNMQQNAADYTMAPYQATVEDEVGLLLVALMTPPFNLMLHSQGAEYRETLPLIVENLQQNGWPVRGVIAPVQLAADFAEAWGRPYQRGVNERLFVLREVTAPRLVGGKLRLAVEQDVKIVAGWINAFFAEALPEMPFREGQLMAEQRISGQTLYVWEGEDGKLTTMAATSRPLSSTISIVLVYTPPEYRGMGYASNCVAALSQHLLDTGWQSCNLFTDLANPISNSIYQKMGYRPVEDFDEYLFER